MQVVRVHHVVEHKTYRGTASRSEPLRTEIRRRPTWTYSPADEPYPSWFGRVFAPVLVLFWLLVGLFFTIGSLLLQSRDQAEVFLVVFAIASAVGLLAMTALAFVPLLWRWKWKGLAPDHVDRQVVVMLDSSTLTAESRADEPHWGGGLNRTIIERAYAAPGPGGTHRVCVDPRGGLPCTILGGLRHRREAEHVVKVVSEWLRGSP